MIAGIAHSIESQGRHFGALCLMLLMLWAGLFASSSYAGENNILVVMSKDSKPYQEFANVLRESVGNTSGQSALDIEFQQVAEMNNEVLTADGGKQYRLIVTVGSLAARKILALKLKVPIVSTLIPKRTYDVLRNKIDGLSKKRIFAIYLDQPAERKFGLIRAALPDLKNVGVIVGPSTQSRIAELNDAARSKNIKLDSKEIENESGLLDALNDILENSEVLLTVADPTVVNRNTLQSVFMTSYMKRIPVIAYSRSYVRAGALMAVYSTPGQIGLQTGELLLFMEKRSSWGGRQSYYPKYFSVAVNDRVARSLGLLLKDKDQIQSAMKAMEGAQ